MKEKDLNGLSSDVPGAKLDLGKNRLSLVIDGFSKALLAVGEVGTFGANKYTDNGWKQVDNGIQRYTDALYRHQLKEATGELIDDDSGLLHAAHAAWNSLARLELLLKMEQPQEQIIFKETFKNKDSAVDDDVLANI